MGKIGAFCKHCKHKLKDSEVEHTPSGNDIQFTAHCNNCNRDLDSTKNEIDFKRLK